MNSISPNLNIMIKASRKSFKNMLLEILVKLKNYKFPKKDPTDFVTNADLKARKNFNWRTIKKQKKLFIYKWRNRQLLKIIKIKIIFGLLIQLTEQQISLHGIPHFAISIALKSKNEIIKWFNFWSN